MEAQVRFAYRHFPLPQHKNAKLAATVAEAAGKQGKFWEMHDLIFQNQSDWSEEKKRGGYLRPIRPRFAIGSGEISNRHRFRRNKSQD